MKSSALLAILFAAVFTVSCSPSREAKRSLIDERAGGQSIHRPVVNVEKKPAWLILAGLDELDIRGGDVVTIGGKAVHLPGTVFTFENDTPESDPLVVTFRVGNAIIYWKGRGKITNTASGERVVLPLSAAEDPRSDAERRSFFDNVMKSRWK